MDPELKRLLSENLAVAKDNNAILRSMRHHQWLSTLLSAVFWIAVVVAPLFFYQQYLAPIFAKMYGTSGTSGPFGLPTSAELQKLLDSYKAGQTR
ncbi:MAG TPA: hypothetical protein VFP46_02025 [Candidatus Paceibacterota bacterium]|nr:hypothetical protein [Candidatus Paceibacterota bacterium]